MKLRWFYALLVVLCWTLLTLCAVLVIDNCANPHETELIYIPGYLDDEVVVIQTRTPVTGIIRCQADPQGVRSGMPCDRYEEVKDEQETSEEVVDWEQPETEAVLSVNETFCEVYEPETQTASAIPSTTQTLAVFDDEPVTEPIPTEDVPAGDATPEDCPEGDVMALGDLEDYLRGQLAEAGAEWFYPYAWCQVMQESNWNPWAENANGQDKGLLQYRLQYWRELESIFDPYAQIRRYVREVTARINAGLTVEEVISRHYTSDYVPGINWEYVGHVLSWMR